MFSIGILGFLVWSLFVSLDLIKELVALLCCEPEVINLAICCNNLTALGTIICKNSIIYFKTAGYCLSYKISSETICETTCIQQNFSAFHVLYAKLGFSNTILDNWLSWFVGFSEKDGAIISYNGQPLFVLTQKEESVLQHILSVLGFGTVRKTDNNGTIVYR